MEKELVESILDYIDNRINELNAISVGLPENHIVKGMILGLKQVREQIELRVTNGGA